MKKFLTFLGLAAFARASVLLKRDCTGNNCLRAIRNPDRPGVADCSSYLQATYTPATITYYVTQTESVTAIETDGQTEYDTIHVTATNTIDTTAVVTVTTTDTITSTFPLHKRQATVIPSDIPVYATPCSGAVRYSSACSCLGVLPTTLTVEAPSTTITISATVTTTITVSPTVATALVTVTDATVNSVVTVATSTQTKTVIDAVVAQCLSTNLASAPVQYQLSTGSLVRAGVSNYQVVSASSPEECCSSCFKNGVCFAFSWGNYDPAYEGDGRPPVSPGNLCYHYIEVVVTSCTKDYVAFGPDPSVNIPAGGSSMWGYGGCQVLQW
ncbi:hypothetical protein AA313_de0201486 [Arthrobotrys entomopaga]|nr:hypothetical protein AA313_de0201486 [Arthrobotrys entomopaga]